MKMYSVLKNGQLKIRFIERDTTKRDIKKNLVTNLSQKNRIYSNYKIIKEELSKIEKKKLSFQEQKIINK